MLFLLETRFLRQGRSSDRSVNETPSSPSSSAVIQSAELAGEPGAVLGTRVIPKPASQGGVSQCPTPRRG